MTLTRQVFQLPPGACPARPQPSADSGPARLEGRTRVPVPLVSFAPKTHSAPNIFRSQEEAHGPAAGHRRGCGRGPSASALPLESALTAEWGTHGPGCSCGGRGSLLQSVSMKQLTHKGVPGLGEP